MYVGLHICIACLCICIAFMYDWSRSDILTLSINTFSVGTVFILSESDKDGPHTEIIETL